MLCCLYLQELPYQKTGNWTGVTTEKKIGEYKKDKISLNFILDILNAIKIIEDYKIPPVIAFTANALSGMKNKYLSNGFDDYLEKPLKNAELMRVLNKYFYFQHTKFELNY